MNRRYADLRQRYPAIRSRHALYFVDRIFHPRVGVAPPDSSFLLDKGAHVVLRMHFAGQGGKAWIWDFRYSVVY
jgi:hypothetical protein